MPISRKIIDGSRFVASSCNSLVNAGTIATGVYPFGICISTGGTSVYVINQSSRTISIFTRNTSTGALTSSGTITPTGTGAMNGICISTDGLNVYVTETVTMNSQGVVLIFTRNLSTGALSGTTTIATGADPEAICISADGTNVYVINRYSRSISIFARNTSTGALSGTSTIVSTASDPYKICISPDGKSVYVLHNIGGAIKNYTRNLSTGALSETSTIAISANATDFCISADGTSVYVTNQFASTVLTLARNTSTGALSGTSTIATGNSPKDICISADGTSVYTNDGGTVSIFDRNLSTGALSGTSRITTTSDSKGICISSDGQNVYAVGYFSETVSILSRTICCVTGGLTLTDPLTLGGPILVSNDGLYVYNILNIYNSGTLKYKISVNGYARNYTTGALTYFTTTQSPDLPYNSVGGDAVIAVLSADGKRIYVAAGNGFLSDMASFIIDPTTHTTTFVNFAQISSNYAGGGNQVNSKKLVTSNLIPNSSTEVFYLLHFGRISAYIATCSSGNIQEVTGFTQAYPSSSNLDACISSDNKYMYLTGGTNFSGAAYTRTLFSTFELTAAGGITWIDEIRTPYPPYENVCAIIMAPLPNIKGQAVISDHIYVITEQSIYFYERLGSGFRPTLNTRYIIDDDGQHLNEPVEPGNRVRGLPAITRIGEQSNLYYKIQVYTNPKMGHYARDPWTGYLTPLTSFPFGGAFSESETFGAPIEGGHVYTQTGVYKQNICPQRSSIFKPLSGALYLNGALEGTLSFTDTTLTSGFAEIVTSGFTSNTVGTYPRYVQIAWTNILGSEYMPSISVVFAGGSVSGSSTAYPNSNTSTTLNSFRVDISWGSKTAPTR